MAKDKRSFFERLTGSVHLNDDVEEPRGQKKPMRAAVSENGSWMDSETEEEGELTVDVYQTPEVIVIKSMIAGVRPEDLDISITRDSVTIHGKREEERVARDEDYFARELYWGSFSRTITLPEEIDVDEAE
ncbi:MAG: Hsp20/alpha crystallin family protein, partial [Patescibacteria group bacterium]|nr:Hsp20/alpha crystallin family protein [Patescibacteria group bacterium]